jgi:site-specific recombinase XerD
MISWSWLRAGYMSVGRRTARQVSIRCRVTRYARCDAYSAKGLSSHVFMSERDGPMTPKAFHALFGRIGSRAKMQFPIHPHMLRHGCGYALANAGHDTRALQAWLGHKNIQHTVRYTELAPDRFKNFWR